MVRVLAVVNLLTGAVNAKEPDLPVPPIPPAEPPLAAAPVPDLHLIGQFDDTLRSAVTLDLAINHRAAPSSGLGYSRGANYQIDNDRRFFVLPGVLVHVPLP
jgi:hypothetical protein